MKWMTLAERTRALISLEHLCMYFSRSLGVTGQVVVQQYVRFMYIGKACHGYFCGMAFGSNKSEPFSKEECTAAIAKANIPKQICESEGQYRKPRICRKMNTFATGA